MTKKELNDLFDSAAPTELQRERMLRNILTKKGESSFMDTTNTATGSRSKGFAFRVAAAALALCLVSALCFQIFGSSPLSLQVYAFESGQEITDQWLQGGHLYDDGSADGCLFYLNGDGIERIHFTTQNQYLTFKDWSGAQEQVWRSQDFTITYGPDAPSDAMVYYWDCLDALELLDREDVGVADLPDDLRHDTITMEATFTNGKTLTQALTIEVLDNGEVTLTLAK